MPGPRPHAPAHAHTHAVTRVRERRQRLATEAARLMVESGLRDYHLAKRKAAQRLGIFDDASLPGNREIEQALREYQRLFQRTQQPEALRLRRQAALPALEFFAAFQPRLVGPVWDGTADAHSVIALHLHSDDPEAVPRYLAEHGIPARPRHHRLRLDPERELDAPAWLFSADGLEFDVTVLPSVCLRQAPLSGVDGRPMRRGSARRLRELLAAEEIAGYEADALPR
ncbi:hypothetical protein [Thermomonas alba]|uniref:hypothetical protein n=1 Tax=Thermomonas alba TaxID=2888525 RepID=UPI001F039386|nr:hypothetical protein [Thermomonas alba]